jgi:hypothetical protein
VRKEKLQQYIVVQCQKIIDNNKLLQYTGEKKAKYEGMLEAYHLIWVQISDDSESLKERLGQ